MLEVRTRKLGEVSFFRLQGRVAVGETDGLLDTVLSQTDAKLVVLDRRRVVGIDAGGLGVLLKLREQLQANRVGFKLKRHEPRAASPALNRAPLPPKAELEWWYQFYFATERGRAGYEKYRRDFAKLRRLPKRCWT